jgi:hypothetical protein
VSAKLKDVYVITERGDNEKAYWQKVGIAFVNRDDSLNVVLDVFPLSGKLHIRERSKKPAAQSEE